MLDLDRPTIVYVSDFDLRGSGYMNIAVALCRQLADRGFQVVAIGLGYKRQEHDHPFTVIPSAPMSIVPMYQQLLAQGLRVMALVVALDVPLQIAILDGLGQANECPYIGIFPLESGPLSGVWAAHLLRMDKRLVMSKHALQQMEAAGVPAHYIEIGVDIESWRSPTEQERKTLRDGMGLTDDDFVILTVADNQERKNLSCAIEAVSRFSVEVQGRDGAGYANKVKEKRQTSYWMVTRPRSKIGWELEDYAARWGILDRLTLWERGVPFANLWALFAAADVFLLTSKAEGLAMPVLEAMSVGLPVVATDCTAIADHIKMGRGMTIPVEYVHNSDPFGNAKRYYASALGAAMLLKQLSENEDGFVSGIIQRARGYAHARKWEKTADELIAAIVTTKEGQNVKETAQTSERKTEITEQTEQEAAVETI